MDTRPDTVPEMFSGRRNFSDEVSRRIVQSEIEGGVHLADLPKGAKLRVETENRCYAVVVRDNASAYISGHPVFCPDPILVNIHGSSWGGSMLKTAYIGRGMHLEFHHPDYETITTSKIVNVRSESAPS